MIFSPHPPAFRPASRSPGRRSSLYAVAALLAFGLLAAPPARGRETADAPSEVAFLGELPVVLSATRLAQPLAESPVSITVIDRALIEASGAVDIPDVLRLVPGVQVGHADGAHFIVTYHGLADVHARRLQVLVDGRSVYSPDFGRVLWTDLPLAIEDIERIEFIRGPNGASYGANSFVGVINIITRHPLETQGVEANGRLGSWETRRYFARAGGMQGDLSYRVSLAYRADEGFPQIKDDKHVAQLNYRGEYRASRRDIFDIQFGINDNTRGTGSGADENPQRELEATSHFQSLRWRRVLGAEEEWSLHFYHNYQRLFDTYQTALISEILDIPPALVPVLFGVPDQRLTIDQDVWAQRFDLEFQHTLAAAARGLRLVWGAELRRDRVRGPGWFDTAAWQVSDLARLFANTEWRFAPRWILNAGLMYEHNDLTGGDFSPRLALNYALAEGHSLRASASRAWRTPSIFERYANTLARAADGTLLDRLYVNGGPLRPERITAYELGYLGDFQAASATLDLKLYYEEIRDIIASPVDESASDKYVTARNDGEADNYGWELSLQWRPWPATRLVAAQAYAHVRGRYLERFTATNQTYKDAAKLTPVHTQSALLVQRLPHGWEASLGYYKVGNMEFGNNDATGGYDNLELRLAYRIRHGGWRGALAFQAQHLAGRYFDAERDAVFDRRYFTSLRLEFR